MKMVALLCGKQRVIHGPAVNVPTNLTPVCTSPKASISNSDGSHEAEEEIVLQGTLHVPVHSPSKSTCSPTVVEIALYKDVEINRDWLSDAPQDDAELYGRHYQQSIAHHHHHHNQIIIINKKKKT